MAVRLPVAAGRARLLLRDYPQIARPGGHLIAQPEGATSPIFIFHFEGGEYRALSSVCTHLGCIVEVAGEELVCPCHGSTFERTGAVVRGPASRNLREYPLTLEEGGILVLDLESTR
jgi:Rieske Fe-S protein